MKRLMTFVLVLAIVFALAECMRDGQADKPAASIGGTSEAENTALTNVPDEVVDNSANEAWTIKIGYTDEEEKELSQEDISTISNVLNKGNWIDDLTKCESDCVIKTADGDVFCYHSACGTFNDNKNCRSLSTTGEETALINSILKQYGELEVVDRGMTI